MTEYYVKLSEECYIYDIIHLLAKNTKEKCCFGGIDEANSGAVLPTRHIPTEGKNSSPPA